MPRCNGCSRTGANCKRLDVVEDTLQAIEAVKQEFSQWKAKLDELISATEEQMAAAQAVAQQRLEDVQVTFDKRVTELQEGQQKTIERCLRDEKNRHKDKLGEYARDYDERLKALQTSDFADILEAQKQVASETEARYSKQRIQDVQADHERHIKTIETCHRKALADQQASFDAQIEIHQKYRSLQDKLRVAKTDRDNVNTLLAKQQKNAKAKVNHLEAQTQRLEGDKQDLEAQTQRLEGDKQDLEVKTQRLEADKLDLEAQSQRLEANNQNFRARTQQLETNNRILKAKTKQLEANNQVVQRQNEQLETDKQTLQQQQEKATKEQEVLERSRGVAIDRIKKLQQALKDKQEQIQEQSVTISADSKRLKVLEKEMAALENYIAGLETRVGSMDNELQSKAVTISTNEHSIKSLEGTNKNLRLDIEATAAALLERQGRIDELTKQLGRQDERVTRRGTIIMALRTEVDKAKELRATEYAQAKDKMERLQDHITFNEENLASQTSTLEEKNKLLEKLEQTREELRSEISSCKHSEDQLKSESDQKRLALTMAESERTVLNGRIETLRGEASDRKSKQDQMVQHLEEELEATRSTIKSRDDDLRGQQAQNLANIKDALVGAAKYEGMDVSVLACKLVDQQEILVVIYKASGGKYYWQGEVQQCQVRFEGYRPRLSLNHGQQDAIDIHIPKGSDLKGLPKWLKSQHSNA